MAITARHDALRGHVIDVSGRFDFSCHNEFRKAYSHVQPGESVVVDLQDANYVDSAALGMLLLLRDHVGSARLVGIVNSSGQPDQVLRIANFHRLFRYGAPRA